MDRDVSPSTLEAAASVQSSPETETEATRVAMVEQIAAALDISLDTLSQPEGSHSDRTRVLTENTEALRLFAGMTDSDARQRSLAYLRWIAEQSSAR